MDKRKSIQIATCQRGSQKHKASEKYTGQRIAIENDYKKPEFEQCKFVRRRNVGIARFFGQDRTFQVCEYVWYLVHAASQTGSSVVNSWQARQGWSAGRTSPCPWRYGCLSGSWKAFILCQRRGMTRSESFGKQGGFLPLGKGRWWESVTSGCERSQTKLERQIGLLGNRIL